MYCTSPPLCQISNFDDLFPFRAQGGAGGTHTDDGVVRVSERDFLRDFIVFFSSCGNFVDFFSVFDFDFSESFNLCISGGSCGDHVVHVCNILIGANVQNQIPIFCNRRKHSEH